MYKITEKRPLHESVDYMKISAPMIARKARPGQFVIIRADEYAERIPLTLAEADPEAGTVSVIFQKVGASTMKLGLLKTGDVLSDVVGPLGKPTETEGYKKVAVIGGGLGCAIAYPQAKALHDSGAHVDVIDGFINKDLVILEKELAAVSDTMTVMTDDGSNGNKGLVTDALKKKIEEGAGYDLVIAIGPVIMMKFVSLLTKQYGIKTIVSMNPIMIDGTGMCGGCRVTVGGVMKFACVDGPDFDGHEVDFDELMRRNRAFAEEEKKALEDHKCKIGLGGNG